MLLIWNIIGTISLVWTVFMIRLIVKEKISFNTLPKIIVGLIIPISISIGFSMGYIGSTLLRIFGNN